MEHHTFDASRPDRLEPAERRHRFLPSEELLWALDISCGDAVVDLRSGTGFYTDDVAPQPRTVYGVDVQEAMHDSSREKGVPETSPSSPPR